MKKRDRGRSSDFSLRNKKYVRQSLTSNSSGLEIGWINQRYNFRFPSTLDLAECGNGLEMGPLESVALQWKANSPAPALRESFRAYYALHDINFVLSE